MAIHPESEKLATAFINHFFAADHSIKWLEVEREAQMWLDPHTLLVGRIDAVGEDEAGRPFFGEWKTASSFHKNKMAEAKAQWRFDPQSLTYGVLGQAVNANINRFTVRWALKTNPVICDFEWYTYTLDEVEWWRTQLIHIGSEIREERKLGRTNWQVSPAECFKYGVKYVCPHFHEGCSKLKFQNVPDGFAPRVSHLQLERNLQNSLDSRDVDLVVLDASRVDTWLGCREKYRKNYEQSGWGLQGPSGEALIVGTDFHALLREHYKSLIEAR